MPEELAQRPQEKPEQKEATEKAPEDAQKDEKKKEVKDKFKDETFLDSSKIEGELRKAINNKDGFEKFKEQARNESPETITALLLFPSKIFGEEFAQYDSSRPNRDSASFPTSFLRITSGRDDKFFENIVINALSFLDDLKPYTFIDNSKFALSLKDHLGIDLKGVGTVLGNKEQFLDVYRSYYSGLWRASLDEIRDERVLQTLINKYAENGSFVRWAEERLRKLPAIKKEEQDWKNFKAQEKTKSGD